jgi:hypothetical protein
VERLSGGNGAREMADFLQIGAQNSYVEQVITGPRGEKEKLYKPSKPSKAR